MSYDPLQPDAYAEHLSAVNDSKQVTLLEDVRNVKGILIAKKGQRISADTVQRIVQFKLLKPLEQSVEIADTLTDEKILADFQGILLDDARKNLHRHYEMQDELARCMGFFARFAMLRQKLTVLSMQMQHEYRKSLMVAWIGLMIARKLDLPPSERNQLFVAALAHDLGMLHIDRAIVDKTGDLTPDEWRATRGHVAIGSLIVREIGDMPPPVSRAVLEHHEIGDGTGFLSGLHGDELSLLGQIVGVVDAMGAVVVRLRTQGRGMRDLVPVLRVNSYLYHRDVCAAFIQLLRESEHPEAGIVADNDIAPFTEQVLQDRESLGAYAAALKRLIDALPADRNRKSIDATRRAFAHLNNVARGSGVLEEGYVEWLRSVATDKQRTAYRDVEDTRLILDEVRFQLLKATRLLGDVEQDRDALNPQERAALSNELGGLPSLPPISST